MKVLVKGNYHPFGEPREYVMTETVRGRRKWYLYKHPGTGTVRWYTLSEDNLGSFNKGKIVISFVTWLTDVTIEELT